VNEPTRALVRCLSIHASYRCRDSGACCASGWPIPVEAPIYERLVGWLKDGSLTTVLAPACTPFERLAAGDAEPDSASVPCGARGPRAQEIDFDHETRLAAEVRAAVPSGGVIPDVRLQQRQRPSETVIAVHERWVAPVGGRSRVRCAGIWQRNSSPAGAGIKGRAFGR
jgi:hypothetical protein